MMLLNFAFIRERLCESVIIYFQQVDKMLLYESTLNLDNLWKLRIHSIRLEQLFSHDISLYDDLNIYQKVITLYLCTFLNAASVNSASLPRQTYAAKFVILKEKVWCLMERQDSLVKEKRLLISWAVLHFPNTL